MKPSNPFEQLRQWKASHKTQAQAQAQEQSHLVRESIRQHRTPEPKPEPTACEPKSADKQACEPKTANMDKNIGTKSRFLTYSQLTRQFTLMNEATYRCKVAFTDDFHHKLAMAKECRDLSKRLKAGKLLLKTLKEQSEQDLPPEMQYMYRGAIAGINYLVYHLTQTADYVDAVEAEAGQGGLKSE